MTSTKGINPTFDLLKSKENKAPVSKDAELIKKCKIDINEILTPPTVALSIKSNNEIIPLFTKGDFSIVTGKAKSRKSEFVYMCLASAMAGNFENHMFCENKGLNILFDTEQSSHKAQQNSHKIIQMAGSSENFKAYSLRAFDCTERLGIINEVLEESKNLNIVVIDGIVNLALDPILNVVDATEIIQNLMVWTEKYNCHIICVLHQNKGESKTLLGHLGSFAHRKADSVLEVTKDTQNKNISIVTAYDCRENEFKPFCIQFEIKD